MLWIGLGLFSAGCFVAVGYMEITGRLERIYKQNDRQLDMLIALLQKNGINPVTFDDDTGSIFSD
jgi:hypothetical protein